MDPREVERQAKLAAQAEWVWPALCLSTLWAVGLLMSLPWLLTWLGASMLGLTALVMMAVYRYRRSAVGAVWAGGAVISGLGVCIWLTVLAVFHSY